MPRPVTMPALGTSPYISLAARALSSRNGLPGSSSRSTRSRTRSLPRSVCLVRAASLPPAPSLRTAASRARRSSARPRIVTSLWVSVMWLMITNQTRKCNSPRGGSCRFGRVNDAAVRWAESQLGATIAAVTALTGGTTSTMLRLRDTAGHDSVLRLMTNEPWRTHGAELTARERDAQRELASTAVPAPTSLALDADGAEIGRASCRERVCQYV